MFLNFYRKNLWFHNYFVILQRHHRFIETTCVIARFFLLFSPVFFDKSEGVLLRFLCFCDFYYFFDFFQAFLWVFFAKYSDYCTRFLVCADDFPHIFSPFCLFIFAIPCRLCAYILLTTFTSWYLRRADRGFAFGAEFMAVLFCFSTWRRLQDFATLREGRIFARDVWRFFGIRVCRICYVRFSVIAVNTALNPTV